MVKTANILLGVTIGKNTVVGANALMTKDVSENKVIMGVLAIIVGNVANDKMEV